MLELKKIKKTYVTDGFKQVALNDVSLNFRDNEFVSILGPSGSGKTTLLNIIGGLDRYDEGDLIINNISTKKYKDRAWDSYRNHTVGFVFQSYNLIPHQSVLANVELALTISGVSRKKRKELATEALKKVGLIDHIHKRPSQLSGGQMQRVAIARALVNNPDILLADEPTGALDTKTSDQVMKLLKEVGKDRLVIMVTHNSELANEYSTRIVNLKDGKIIGDTNPYRLSKKRNDAIYKNLGKAKMGIFTAFQLSLKNLLTKKGRTILTAFAGSIGIIGIALILSVATGFQNYIDKMQEDTLSSYPLTIQDETADATSILLSISGAENETGDGKTVTEKKNIANMFESVGKNDLKSFKFYLEDNKNKIDEFVKMITYQYDIEPIVYTKNIKGNIYKSNPSETFSTLMGGGASSSFMNMSVFGLISENEELTNDTYEIIKGRMPKKYDEIILVLPDEAHISDLLLYTIGLKDDKELDDMISDLMDGKKVKTSSDTLTFTLDELMNIDLRLILPYNLYKYNKKLDIYENMEEDKKFMQKAYEQAERLHIVGIAKMKDSNRMGSLMSGVGYTSDLVKYIINSSKDSEIVKKQLSNKKINVFNGKKFTAKNDDTGLNFNDMISIDKKKIKEAFGGKTDNGEIELLITEYMEAISNAISVDYSDASNMYLSKLNNLLKSYLKGYISKYGIDMGGDRVATININTYKDSLNKFMKSDYSKDELKDIEKEYAIPYKVSKEIYSNTISGIVEMIIAIGGGDETMISSNTIEPIINGIITSDQIVNASVVVGKNMLYAKMQRDVLKRVGKLTEGIIKNMASSMKVDTKKLASAFKFNLDEDELKRIFKTMTNSNNKVDYKTNLQSLGYQDLDSPSSISFYFKDFAAKERFIDFINSYNEKMKDVDEDKVIEYTDITGVLISNVKVIVDSVSYVLIAFVSISLVVSSIMIGIITYISVLERTKEIGILRAIGASKKNISSIFNAETFIIGLFAGAIGIGTSLLLLIPINNIIHALTKNNDITAVLPMMGAIRLVILSIILTLIGGLIPSKGASRKDPVEALRSE